MQAAMRSRQPMFLSLEDMRLVKPDGQPQLLLDVDGRCEWLTPDRSA
jgi:hypothetical protein